MTDKSFEDFHAAYIEALYFTDTGDEDQAAQDAKLSPDAAEICRADCLSFWHRFGRYVDAAKMTPQQAGHDFWLTRNGHGAGFWDGDWPEPYADMLTKGSKSYGEIDVYLSDADEIEV